MNRGANCSFLFAAILATVLIQVTSLAAETWYVNNEAGRDTFDGLSAEAKGDGVHGPFATLKRGVAALKTSDRLELARTSHAYRETLVIGENYLEKGGIGGTPDKPLVVAGNGATIDGLDVVPSSQWTREADGTFSTPFQTNSNKLNRVKDVMTWIGAPQIWFVNGQPAPNAKSAQELSHTPGGFYWDKGGHRLYFKLPPTKKLGELRIEIPVRGSGVNVYGTDYVVVQNLRSVHSLNNGVGTGTCIGVVFRHVEASDNCDQGFSAHNGAVNLIEDCRFERNAGSGICNVYDSVTVFRRCSISNNTFESGAYFLNDGFHVLEDCIIAGNDDGPQVLVAGNARVQLHNCLVRGRAGNATPLVEAQGGRISLDQCTVADGVVGAQVAPGNGFLAIGHSLFTRCGAALAVIPVGAEQRFVSNHNGWRLGTLAFGGTAYTNRTWPEYQRNSGQDANSLTEDPQLGGPDASVLSPGSLYRRSGREGRRIGADLAEGYDPIVP